MSEQPYNDSLLDKTATVSELNNLGAVKNIPLSSFDNYAIDSSDYFRNLIGGFTLFCQALPLAMLTGGFFGALFLTLPSFFSEKYLDLYTSMTCDAVVIVPTAIDFELEGIIQGSIINIILAGLIVAIYKEPLSNKIVITTGVIAGILAFIFCLSLRTGFVL